MKHRRTATVQRILGFLIAGASLMMLPPALVSWWYADGTASLFLVVRNKNADPAAFARAVPEFLAYLAYNFPSPALPLAAVGIASLARHQRSALALVGTTLVVYGAFAAAYRHHGIWVAYTTHAWLAVAVLA